MAFAAFTVIPLEVFIGLALWSRKWRTWAVAVGVLFHALLVAGIGHELRIPILVFALQLMALYPLFFLERTGPSTSGASPSPTIAGG